MITDISVTLGTPSTKFDLSVDPNSTTSMTITVSQSRREGKVKNGSSSSVKLNMNEVGALIDMFNRISPSVT